MTPELSIHPDRTALAEAAATRLARIAADAIAARGTCSIALSGGSTPWAMLAALAKLEVDWARVHVFQVDERAAPAGDEARNWTHLDRSLLQAVALPGANQHPMPVELADAQRSAERYARELEAVCGGSGGSPPVLDVVQLGLGSDGHTASLVPDDPVLEVDDVDVAWSRLYQGTHRMTLTYPALDRARHRLWLVAGADKAGMVRRVVAADASIPGGRIRAADSVLMLDAAAAAELGGAGA